MNVCILIKKRKPVLYCALIISPCKKIGDERYKKKECKEKKYKTNDLPGSFIPGKFFQVYFFFFLGCQFSGFGFSRFPHRIFSGIAFQLIGHMNKDNKKPSTMDSSCFQHLHNFVVKSWSL